MKEDSEDVQTLLLKNVIAVSDGKHQEKEIKNILITGIAKNNYFSD